MVLILMDFKSGTSTSSVMPAELQRVLLLAKPDGFYKDFCAKGKKSGQSAKTLLAHDARSYYENSLFSLVAQSVEQVTVNHRVGGSSPSQGAIFSKPLRFVC